MDPLVALAELVAADGGLLAAASAPPEDRSTAVHGRRAAAGPRARGREKEYAVAVEAIREGYELHYGAGRVVTTSDPDLALLAGDRLYALGLARLAALEDVQAVAELADVIALAAVAHAEDDPARAEAAWVAGVAAVGHGRRPGHAAAKDAARRGDPAAAEALTAVARQACETAPDGHRAPLANG
jgi:hypothetical protein